MSRKPDHTAREREHAVSTNPDDNLQGNPYAEIAENCVDALEEERYREAPRKREMAFLLGNLQANTALAAAWETRQLRLALEADRGAIKVDTSDEMPALVADLTKPQSDATTPAKELNPGDIVLIPMVVQPLENADVVSLKPMEERLKFDVTGAWAFRNLAFPVMFQRTVKGPAR